MPTLRAIRLLNSVEAGSTSGTELQTFLTEGDRLSEFRVLLSMRGQTRRIAASPETVTAIISSSAATDAVFAAASQQNSTACNAVVQSPLAMSIVAASASTLTTVATNPVSWNLFTESQYYGTNIKGIVSLLADVLPSDYADISALVNDSVSMAKIAVTAGSMKASIASQPMMELITQSSFAMESIASSVSSISILASSEMSMQLVGGSTIALNQLTPAAHAIIAATPLAILTLSKNETTWPTVIDSAEIESNLKNILANTTGLNASNYGAASDIIADASALAAVAGYKPAMQALVKSAAAITALATSPNVGVVLASAVAMSVIGPNTNAMLEILANPAATAAVFASSIAKGFIVTSTPMVDYIAGNADILAYLEGFSAKAIPTSNKSGTTTVSQPFDGIPSKVLTLRMRANNIGAIAGKYNFGGYPAAGTGATAQTDLKGSSAFNKVAGYSDAQWGVIGIAVTAAASPEWVYVDMT